MRRVDWARLNMPNEADRLRALNGELVKALEEIIRCVDNSAPTNTGIWLGESIDAARATLKKAKGSI